MAYPSMIGSASAPTSQGKVLEDVGYLYSQIDVLLSEIFELESRLLSPPPTPAVPATAKPLRSGVLGDLHDKTDVLRSRISNAYSSLQNISNNLLL